MPSEPPEGGSRDSICGVIVMTSSANGGGEFEVEGQDVGLS